MRTSKKVSAKAAESRHEKYRKLLANKRLELMGSLEEVKFDTMARIGRVAEEDQAQISHEEFIGLHRNSMDYQALRLVEDALDRIETGEYGVCQNCDEPISEKRLAAIPWARYCVSCQDRLQSNSYHQAEELEEATAEV